MLFRKHGPWTEDDLTHLLLAQKPFNGGKLLFGEVAPGYSSVITAQACECRVDPQTAFNPCLNGSRLQRRVHFVAVGLQCETFGDVGRRQLLVLTGSRRLHAVVMPPAEFGPLGVRYRCFGGVIHQFTEPFERTLLVGPHEDRQTFHGAGRSDIEEVRRLFDPLFFSASAASAMSTAPATGPVARKAISSLLNASGQPSPDRVFGRPVETLFPKRKTCGNSRPLVLCIVASFTGPHVPFGYGDEVRHLLQIAQKARMSLVSGRLK